MIEEKLLVISSLMKSSSSLEPLSSISKAVSSKNWRTFRFFRFRLPDLSSPLRFRLLDDESSAIPLPLSAIVVVELLDFEGFVGEFGGE
ncbi:hypothetical protein Hanom_Chr14g01320691 [Helianthus anomalus]